jgi:hypothetical protein
MEKSDLKVLNELLEKLNNGVIRFNELLIKCNNDTEKAEKIKKILIDNQCMCTEYDPDIFVPDKNAKSYYILKYFNSIYKSERKSARNKWIIPVITTLTALIIWEIILRELFHKLFCQ